MATPGPGTATRPITLGQTVTEALRRHQRRQAEENWRAGGAWVEHDLVFGGPRGGPLNPAYPRDGCFYPLLACAGLPRLWFTDLSQAAAALPVWEALAMPADNGMARRDHVRDTGSPDSLGEERGD